MPKNKIIPVVKKKHVKSRNREGIEPYTRENIDANFFNNPSKEKKLVLNKNDSSLKKSNSIDEKGLVQNSFIEIKNSLSKINEYGCQNNEIIEKYHEEQQQKFLINDGNINYWNVCATGTNLKSKNTNIEIYKKNALITQLLHSKEDYCSDLERNVIAPSDESPNSSVPTEFIDKITNSKVSEESMLQERLSKLWQSKNDSDVLYHPLMNIKEDKDWQKVRLKRKGIEETESSRQYFMSIENDSFTFQPN